MKRRCSDGLKLLPTKEPVEPAQVRLIGLDGGLVRSLFQPSDNRFIPGPARSLPELGDAPQLSLQLVVEFLREGFVASPSRAAYSFSIGSDNVDPPDCTTFAK